MRIVFYMLLIFPACVFGQIGLKAGINFANITNANDINNSSRTGFHVGAFLAPTSKGIMGSRTELIFSRQGYDFKSNTKTGNVQLNYIMIPQFMTINITKFVQLQLGGQMAFLLNAKADSSSNAPSGASPYTAIMNYYNRFDYGFAGGVEIHPIKGLLVGARLNISMGKLYKEPQPGQQPSFYPGIDAKNNVLQFFAGYRFGK